MKQLRLAAIVAVVAVSGFAVSNANASKARTPQTWFRAAGAPVDVASSYTLATSQTCGGTPLNVCKIVDEPNSTDPSIPALSFGDVSTHQTQYLVTKRQVN